MYIAIRNIPDYLEIMNDSSKTLLKKIASIRKIKNIKVQNLTLLLAISDEAYKKLEKGIGEITLSQLFKVAESLAWSLFDETEMTIDVDTPQEITEITFTVTIKSLEPIQIEKEITEKLALQDQQKKRKFCKSMVLLEGVDDIKIWRIFPSISLKIRSL